MHRVILPAPRRHRLRAEPHIPVGLRHGHAMTSGLYVVGFIVLGFVAIVAGVAWAFAG